MKNLLKLFVSMCIATVLALGCGDTTIKNATDGNSDGDSDSDGDGDGDSDGDGDGDSDGDSDGDGDGDSDGDSDSDCDWGDASEFYTNVAPSMDPPAGMKIENVPQFIAIGFDDNMFPDSMTWILDFLKDKVNPKGTGDACTFDGTPVKSTFLIASHKGITSDKLKKTWIRAYKDGHEIGNHTDTHDSEILPENPNFSVWETEMNTCHDYLTGEMGVSDNDIAGFRTPFLKYSSATYEAMVDQGLLYDCSIEHYLGASGFDWPYTLDNGQSIRTYALNPGKFAGFWELPVAQFMPTTGWIGVTGFDYNIWCANGGMPPEKALELLQSTLKVHMEGDSRATANRAPFFIGAHTDEYSEFNDDANTNCQGTWQTRRQTIEQFIEWALDYHPDVRFVTYRDVVHWMQRPHGLDGKIAPSGN